MKLFLLATAAALAISGAAHAASCNSANAICPNDATASATGGAGGAGGDGGTAVAVGTGGAGGSSTAFGGTAVSQNTVDPHITVSPTIAPQNHNLNSQGQQQGQQQGQVASSDQHQTQSATTGPSTSSAQGGAASTGAISNTLSTGASASTSHSDNANNAKQDVVVDASQHTPRQVATASAPVVVNVASCAIGGSMAGQGPGFGFSLGGARIDKACDRRANAQILFQLGATEAGLQYLAAGDPAISKALTAARTTR